MMTMGYSHYKWRAQERDYKLPEQIVEMPAKTLEMFMKHCEVYPIWKMYLDKLPSLIKELL